MNRSAIERLLQSSMIERIRVDDDEGRRTLRKTVISQSDSEVRGMSTDGVFKTLYDAGRQAATAFVAAHVYRAKGTSGHHHSLLAAAAALASDSYAALFKQLDPQRGRRHEVGCSAHGEVESEEIDEVRDWSARS